MSEFYPRVVVDGRVVPEPSQENIQRQFLYMGPSSRGPAFIPTPVENESQLNRVFGTGSPVTDSLQVALKSGVPGISVQRVVDVGLANVTRNTLVIKDDSDGTIFAVYIIDENATFSDVDVSGNANEFIVELLDASGNVQSSYTRSLNRFNGNYIEDQPISGLSLYKSFTQTQQERLNATLSYSQSSISFDGIARPKTPWITSQSSFPNYESVPLFRFVIPQQGTQENREIKVSITDIQDGTFTVLVREYQDSDFNPSILESFTNLSLDPDQENYIAKIIGDRQRWFQNGNVNVSGEYDGQSQYIRVEMGQQNLPTEIKPYGFQSYDPVVESSSSSTIPSVRYVESQKIGKIAQYAKYQRNTLDDLFLGFDAKSADNMEYLDGVPSNQDQNPNQEFNIDDLNSGDIIQEQFTVAFQGGFTEIEDQNNTKHSGIDSTSQNLWGLDVSSTTESGYRAFETAFEILENQAQFEFQTITIPDARLQEHTLLCDLCESFCRQQSTVLFPVGYLLPITDFSSITPPTEIIQSSFVACYHGWVDVSDTVYPASNFVPMAFYLHDQRTQEQVSTPSGVTTRITGIGGLERKYTVAEQERILEAQSNTISDFEFAGVGFVGSETLASRESALSHVATRRTLNDISRDIQSRGRNLLFSQTSNQGEIEQAVSDILSFYVDGSSLSQFEFGVSTNNNANGFIVSTFLSFREFIDAPIQVDFVVS